ncbi:MAG TPA: OmpA family protein [Gemmatimonadaceae bacterium]|nr:OmpA family protein [Gemmatimonadaceae bacterium]
MIRRIALAAALAALTVLPAPSRAQGIFGKIKQRASSEVDRKEDQAIDKAVNSISCAFTDKACIKKAHDAGTPIKVTDASGKPVSSADSAAAISAAVAQAASVASDESAPAATVPAPGSSALYDRISANGRATTYGILFDAGSDHIRNSSTPTLAQIGDMLKSHPSLGLTIEGHTDNVGSAAANQKLSDKRAAAVRKYLVSTYAVDSTRLKSVGYGATKPISPNTTAEGRQDNRRIELVKAP